MAKAELQKYHVRTLTVTSASSSMLMTTGSSLGSFMVDKYDFDS